VVVSPDGRRVAVVDGSGTSAVVQALEDETKAPQTVKTSGLSFRFGLPTWESSGDHVVLPVMPTVGGSNVATPGGLPPVIRSWPAGEGSDEVVAAGRGPDDQTLVVVNSHGAVRIQDIKTGAVRRTIPGSRELIAESRRLPTNGAAAAVNNTGDLVAIVINGSVTVTDLSDGTVVGTVPGPDASWVTYSGRRLLVQRTDGRLEVWDARGSTRERVLPGDESHSWPPVANEQGTAVARQRSNGSIVLADLDTSATLATFPSPSGSDALKTGIAFTPDGGRLVTVTESAGGPSNAQLIWRAISDDDIVRTACATAGRNLTAAEWQTFVGTSPPRDLSCR
jgi:hypothetical protein